MDWSAHVRAQLPPLGLDLDREAEIVEEIAQQMEATYEESRTQGADVSRARLAALDTVKDWQRLAHEIATAERSKLQRAVAGLAAPIAREPIGGSGVAQVWREVWQDGRHGLRLLAKHRAFTVTAVVTLALTIGANTAIFSIVDAILLRPLPFPNAEALVTISEGLPTLGFDDIPFSPPDFEDFVAEQRSFTAIGAFRPALYELGGVGTGARITAARVSAGVFDVLGVPPLIGRTFTSKEDMPGSDLAVLSYGLWQSRLGGDPDVVGRTLLLDRRSFTIVGVMPAAFRFPFVGLRHGGVAAEVFVPIGFTPEELEARTNNYGNAVIARLKPDVTIGAARAEADAIAASIFARYPALVTTMYPNARLQLSVADFHGQVVGSSRPVLLVMMATVTVLVLIGCANVGNLVLVLAAGRRRELAVRASLGAGRARLVRQLLVESLVLAGIGGLAGLFLAAWLLAAAPSLLPADLPRVGEIGIDGRMLFFTAFISIATALVFGVAPGLHASRIDMRTALAEGARGTTAGTRRLRAALVVAQCAMAVILLATAGLLVRSFARLLDTNPGFRPEQALSATTFLPAGGYANGADVRAFLQTALERVRRLPGVRHVGLSTDRPLMATEHRAVIIEDHPTEATGPKPMIVQSWIAGEYLESLGVALVRGRWLTDADDADAQAVAVISESLAAQFWPGEDPLGKRLRFTVRTAPWMVVVGIVGDVHENNLRTSPQPHCYTPIAQVPDAALAENVVGMFRAPHFAVATAGDPATSANMVRRELLTIDQQLAFGDVAPMRETLRATLAPQRFTAVIVGVLALAALGLAGIGLHGVLAYGVSQRRKEIGIRMALGASRTTVLTLVLRDGMVLVGTGMAIGVAGALALSGLLRALLFGITPTDPLTFVGVVVVLLAVGSVAIWLPARQATQVEPAITVREA